MLPDGQLSSCYWDSEMPPGFSSLLSNPTSTPPNPNKSSAQLMKEITTLEVQIMHLECHLLSLYRSAFDKQHFSTFSEDATNRIHHHDTGLPLQAVIPNQSFHNKLEPDMQNGDWSSHAHGWASADNLSYAATPKAIFKRNQKKNDGPVHRSLADHLGASCNDYAFTTPDRLSEDIITSISSIFGKLAIPPLSNAGSSTSPISSVSSTSTFSPRNPSDCGSPHFNEESMVHCRFQGDSGPYAAMIEVSKINLNENSFKHAASMLQKFRLMVQSLEKIDPRKMKREGKLAFWINIHNALVMHAYLAYGTRSRVKSSSILKAAYNVGGHSINAYIIQSSILGIRSHYSEPWLQTLLSPGKKSKVGSVRHIYAIEYPEPLVHFALCSGAFSDPAVRVYTAKNIFEDLKLAKKEFIEASVKIHKASKVYLPRILDHFAKDMSLSVVGLIEIVNECISEEVGKGVKRCMKGSTRPEKYICWLPQSSRFGYVIHMGLLAKGGTYSL